MKDALLVPVDTCQISGLQHILYAAFGDKRDGTFVEVGAYDGITYSNTYHLARGGWSGVYIEPVEKLYEQCVGNHQDHNVLVYCELVGNPEDVPQPLWYDGVELYTTKHWLAEALKAGSTVDKFETIQPVSLDSILQKSRNLVNPGFELLVIDVEGAELDVLEGFNIDYWAPEMVIIEAHELHENKLLRQSADLINEYMFFSMYQKIYCDRWNNIYVRSQRIWTVL